MAEAGNRRSLRLRSLNKEDVANVESKSKRKTSIYGENLSVPGGSGVKKMKSDGEDNLGQHVPSGSDSEKNLPMIADDECFVNKMPPEILGCIFKHLSLDDRNSVRLVCRLWYANCCNEKIIFRLGRSDRDIAVIERVLKNCQYTSFDLSFQSVSVHKLSLDLWTRIGSKIHSLEFYHCDLQNDILEKVVLFCSNLQRLRISCINRYCGEKLGFIQNTTALQKLTLEGNSIKTLNSLEIYTDVFEDEMNSSEDETSAKDSSGDIKNKSKETKDTPEDNEDSSDGKEDARDKTEEGTSDGCGEENCRHIFEAIFSLFPNVIHLGLGYFFERSKEDKRICRFSIDTNGCNHEDRSLQTVQIFTDLAVAIFIKDYWMDFLNVLSPFRLTHFEIHSTGFGCTNIAVSHLERFLRIQTELKSIRLNLDCESKQLEVIISDILHGCADLREFHLVYPFIDLPDEKMQQLCSKLPKLECILIPSVKFKNIQSLSYLCRLSLVNKLELTNFPNFMEHDLTIEFLKLCNHNLEYLSLCGSYEVLQHIFQHMIKLKTLAVFVSDSKSICSRDVDGQQCYSISNLRRLETFSISVDNMFKPTSDDEAVEILEELEHPNLRCFQFDYSARNPLPSRVLLQLTSKMPNLTDISLYNSVNEGLVVSSFQVLKEFVKSTKHLRYLSIAIPNNITQKERFLSLMSGNLFPLRHDLTRDVKRVFDACPTLKYITDKRIMDCATYCLTPLKELMRFEWLSTIKCFD